MATRLWSCTGHFCISVLSIEAFKFIISSVFSDYVVFMEDKINCLRKFQNDIECIQRFFFLRQLILSDDQAVIFATFAAVICL